MPNIVSGSFLGRKTSSTGAQEVISISDAKDMLGITPVPTGASITTESVLNETVIVDSYPCSLTWVDQATTPIADLFKGGRSNPITFSLEVLELIKSDTPSPSAPLVVSQVAFVTLGTAKGTYSRTVSFNGTTYSSDIFTFNSSDTSSFLNKSGNEIKTGKLLTTNYGKIITTTAELDSIMSPSEIYPYKYLTCVNTVYIEFTGDVTTTDSMAIAFGSYYNGAKTQCYIITVYTEYITNGITTPVDYIRQRAYSNKNQGWYYRIKVMASGPWSLWSREVDLGKNLLTANRSSFTSIVALGATATSDFSLYDITKYVCTGGSGTSIVATFSGLFAPEDDCCKTAVISNTSGVTLLAILPTVAPSGGIKTFTLLNMKTPTVSIPTGKTVEISYLFEHTAANAITVSITYAIQE